MVDPDAWGEGIKAIMTGGLGALLATLGITKSMQNKSACVAIRQDCEKLHVEKFDNLQKTIEKNHAAEAIHREHQTKELAEIKGLVNKLLSDIYIPNVPTRRR